MNREILLRKKASIGLICCLLVTGAALTNAQTINILGTNPPIPGANDQYQTNMPSGANQPPGLNYYLDNGNTPSQTFTTGNAANGYTLSSLAIYDAGNSGGGFTTSPQTFTLYIYSISGSTATTLASYTSQSLTIPDSRWFVWTNLGAILQPNTQYAWSMHRNGSGWANVGNVSGDLYADPAGQVCSIPTGGGTITYSSTAGYDATFDVGLAPITTPVISQPQFSPYSVAIPGTTITASAAVTGPGPYNFQWKTDGGSGGALTNIPGAAGSNLVINTTGYAVGIYQYALAVTNGSGAGAVGLPGNLTLQQPIGIPGVIAVKFGFTGGYATSDAPFPADNAGVASGQLVPPSYRPLTAVGNWNNLMANIAAGADQPTKEAAINQTWNITSDTAGNALSGVTLTPNGFDDGWFSGGTECANGRLLYDCWKFDTANGLTGAITWPYNFATLTFSNLPNSTYDVYVYVNDNNGNYWGNVEANGVFAVGNSFDLTPYGFNGASSDPCNSSPSLHTAAGFGSPANYVRMPYVATVDGTITVTAAFDDRAGNFGVSAVELVPSQDLTLVQDTLPTYAQTVVGDQVVLTAAFSNSPSVNVQWQQVNGGLTNNISTGVVNALSNGVMTSTLTLANAQSSNAGFYWLKAVNAANSADYSFSSAAQLVVGSVPSATNGVDIFEDAQTGPSFYPPWTINTNSDLILGFQNGVGDPGTFVAGAGNFGLDGCFGDPTILSDGILGNSKATMVSCGPNGGAGASITYYLQTNSSPLGFEVTNIQVYGGWTDAGRRNQDYQVYYSTLSEPTNYISLGTVDYVPADPSGAPIATRTILLPAAGVLAHNVISVQINWSPFDLNGYSGYSEIAIYGTNSTVVFTPVLPTIKSLTTSGGNLNISGTGGTPNANYTWLGTTDLTPPINWVPITQGVLDGSGSLSSSLSMTNSQMFFRLRMP